jgi:hypothetical protein
MGFGGRTTLKFEFARAMNAQMRKVAVRSATETRKAALGMVLFENELSHAVVSDIS